MKIAIKLISLLLCICMLFSACKPQEKELEESTTIPAENTTESNENTEESFSKGDGKISIPYNNKDGLNPFFAKSYENLFVCKLLFDSLFIVDGTYTAKGAIAENISVNGTKATVKIKNNISCRGSSNITAQDVVYSFNLAKASYGWSDDLKGVILAEASGQNTVIFTLGYEDSLVAAKLTFPVVKEGTADIQTAVPTGSGDYYILEEKLVSVADGKKILYLCPISTRDSAEDALKIGSSDVFFSDLSNCDYSETIGKTNEVLLNNMVYIGFNSANGALSQYVRCAVATKVNAEDIALSAYQGHAEATKLPVNPQSSIYSELTSVDTAGDLTIAENILDRCGYTKTSNGVKTNGAYSLKLTLIVNKDNKYRVAAAYNIADSLNECGIKITVKTLPFSDYSERISSGNYDMYLGEVNLDSSMDLSEFFLESGALNKGINLTERATIEYFNYRAGKITAKEYYEIFVEEYPFVPVVFRKGYTVSSDDITLDFKNMPMDLYNGI